MKNPKESKPKAPSLWQVFKSVLAAWFGVQKEAVRERDFQSGKPSQFVIVGILFTAFFIVAVVLIARLGMHLAGV